MDPESTYIPRAIATDSAFYSATKEAVFIATFQDPSRWGEEIWAELSWLYPEEVKVLSSIALAIPEGLGFLNFSPYYRQYPIGYAEEPGQLDVECLKEQTKDKIKDIYGSQTAYSLQDRECYEEDAQKAVYDNIDIEDSILIRGLTCFLKSQHLSRYPAFAEDAFINIQISREAALQIIRTRMAQESGAMPSYADLRPYFQDNFRSGDVLFDDYREQHDKWLMCKHPASDFGTFWTPPLFADDYIETYESLVSVYRHLITGEYGRKTAWGLGTS